MASHQETLMNDLKRAIRQGCREAPLMFFAPIVALVRLISATARDLIAESEQKHRSAKKAHP